MPNPLSTIAIAKEQAATYPPLVLCTLVWPDGTTLRLATMGLNTAEGGVQYGGQNYLGRIKQQNLSQIQSQSENGVDLIPSISVECADPDSYLYTNYEKALGFKGADCTLRLVFYDPIAQTFSSDSRIVFVGRCDTKADSDAQTLTFTAQSKVRLLRAMVPQVPIQPRCPWRNPDTLAKRATTSDPFSVYYQCGESRDLTTAPPCQNTKATCTQLNRFGGITYTPPTGSQRVREYTSGSWADVKSDPNEAKFGDYMPEVYGTAWVQPPLMNLIPDGNYIRGEVIVGYGEYDIIRVTANDIELSPANNSDGSVLGYSSKDFRYNWVNDGGRDGAPNADRPYNGAGDPYGNATAIMVVLPRSESGGGSLNIRVLARRKSLLKYQGIASITVSSNVATATLVGSNIDIASNDPGYTFAIEGSSGAALNTSWSGLTNWTSGPPGTFQWTTSGVANGTYTGGWIRYTARSENAAWTVADLLSRTSFTYADLDIQSFIDLAPVVESRPCALVLRQRRAAAEVVRGICAAYGFQLTPDYATGKLKLTMKRTLAEQQPSAVTGSNYNFPIASKLANGTTANGYAAYRFDAASILRSELPISLKELSRSAADAPNSIPVDFQDRTLDYAQSNVRVVDSDDAARMGGDEITGSLPVQPLGMTSIEAAMRAARVGLAEIHRGNEAGDTRGTRVFQWETSFRALDLRVGQIVLLNDVQKGLTNQPVRLTKISPVTNYERMTLTAVWHNDNWYTDAYAANGLVAPQNRRHDALERPPFAWCPNEVAPAAGDPMFNATQKTFQLDQVYTVAADGSALAQVQVLGRSPVNAIATLPPPRVPLQGTTSTTGGTIPGNRTLWVSVCSKDSNGLLSAPSAPVRVDIPTGTNTNTATVASLVWPSGAAGYAVFAGIDPMQLSAQLEGVGTPSSVTISTYAYRAWGQPDTEFDRLFVRVKRVPVPGVRVYQISARTGTTFTVSGATWTTNQWANRDCSILGHGGSSTLPIANFQIASNDATVLTLTGGSPSPLTLGISVGDYLVIRTKPTAQTSTTVTDSALAMTSGAHVGKQIRVISGTGAGQVLRIKANTATQITADFQTTLDSTSRYIVEESDWAYTGEGASVDNSDRTAPLSMAVEVGNVSADVLLVEAVLLDGGGAESQGVVREVILAGDTGTGGGSIAPAPAVTGLTLTLDTSDPDGFRLNSAWMNPSDLGSTKAMRRVAAYFDDEHATDPIDNTVIDLATFKFRDDPGEFPTAGPDGPFPQWPSADTWVEVWVGLINGDNTVTWTTSNREKIDGGLGPVDPTLSDVVVDDAYVLKEWVAGGCNITSRYEPHHLPGVTLVTDTVAAMVYLEAGANVTSGQNVPYTKAVNASPPADRQPFTIFLPIDWLNAVTPDGSGNRTLWLHACNVQQYSEGVTKTVPYKEHTLQGSFATAPVVFSQAEIDGSTQGTGGIEQPSASDFTVSVLGYGYDPKDGRRVHVQVTMNSLGANATYGDVFKYMDGPGGSGPTADFQWLSEQYITGASGFVEWWELWPEIGGRLYIAVTAGNSGWRNLPTSSTATAYIDIPAWGVPSQVTGASVTVEGPTLIGGVKKGRLKYQWTAPTISDANFFYCAVQLNWCNSSFVQVEPFQRVLGERGYGAHTAYSDWWDWPAANQYRQAKFFSVDWFETENHTSETVVNITVTANSSLLDMTKADTGTMNGLKISGGKLTLDLDTSDFVVSGGKLTANAVNAAKLYNLGSEFTVGGGALLVNAIAVNKLLAGTALFTGGVAFTNSSSGASLGISSSGVIITNGGSRTVTLDSGGVTVASGSNSVAIGATSVVISGGGSSVTVDSAGLTADSVLADEVAANSVVALSVDVTIGPTNYFRASSSGVDVKNLSINGFANPTGVITVLLPSQSGHAGKFLMTDGAGGLSWGTP